MAVRKWLDLTARRRILLSARMAKTCNERAVTFEYRQLEITFQKEGPSLLPLTGSSRHLML